MILFQKHVLKQREIGAYIRGNLDKELSIRALSELFNFKAATLCRHFKAYHGVAINGFIIKSRMEKAWELLSEHWLHCSEVAKMVGYKEQSSFSHAFTDYFKISPRKAMIRQHEKIAQEAMIAALEDSKRKKCFAVNGEDFIPKPSAYHQIATTVK